MIVSDMVSSRVEWVVGGVNAYSNVHNISFIRAPVKYLKIGITGGEDLLESTRMYARLPRTNLANRAAAAGRLTGGGRKDIFNG
jgi:uncharacterized protein with ACT and thioredoxin-like domain